MYDGIPEYEMLGEDGDYDEAEYIGATRRRRKAPRRRPGKRQQVIRQRRKALNSLQQEARDRAAAQKELIAGQKIANFWTDPITGETFKVFPIVLTESEFTVTANTASAETTIGTYTVPNGIELLFRAVKSGVAGAYLDRAAPYLHGTLKTSSNVDVSGTLRLKVLDASQNDLVGQPYTGSSGEFNDASSIDWNLRLFFNSVRAIRANSGNIVQLTLNSASVIDTSTTYTNWVLHLLQLSKQ